MPMATDVHSLFSNFYLDGEGAFMDGVALDQNPYVTGDDAAAASHAAATVMAGREDIRLRGPV